MERECSEDFHALYSSANVVSIRETRCKHDGRNARNIRIRNHKRGIKRLG